MGEGQCAAPDQKAPPLQVPHLPGLTELVKRLGGSVVGGQIRCEAMSEMLLLVDRLIMSPKTIAQGASAVPPAKPRPPAVRRRVRKSREHVGHAESREDVEALGHVQRILAHLRAKGELAFDTFARIDKDHNGTLDLGELKAAMRQMNIKLSDAEMQLVWRHFDTDGSGDVDITEFRRRLDPAHFAAARSKSPEQENRPQEPVRCKSETSLPPVNNKVSVTDVIRQVSGLRAKVGLGAARVVPIVSSSDLAIMTEAEPLDGCGNPQSCPTHLQRSLEADAGRLGPASPTPASPTPASPTPASPRVCRPTNLTMARRKLWRFSRDSARKLPLLLQQEPVGCKSETSLPFLNNKVHPQWLCHKTNMS